MLTLLLGRAGSGKTNRIMQKIRENGTHRSQILLVPEQVSYETERRLCEINGNTASLYAEVFSFTSFANRILNLFGGKVIPALDDGGRILVMYAALKAVSSNLSVLSLSAQKPEFLTRLISAVDELKSFCVSPQTLGEIAAEVDGLSGKKMQDLSLIFAAYDAMTSKGMRDPRDGLTKLAETLRTASFVEGKDWYIDGFTDFTPQEEQVIQELILQGNEITVALTCDHLQETDQDTGIFSTTRHTAYMLKKMAEKNHIPVKIETVEVNESTREPILSLIEQNLFSKESLVYSEDVGAVLSLFSATTRREEVEWAAGKIRQLLQSGKVKCRDIAVSARNIEPYRELLETVFARYQIPLFQSSMQPILQKPIFTLVIAALNIITGNFAYEDVFRYLKTGLTNISLEECDALENYVLTWNIRGSQWTSSQGFIWNPNGYQKQMDENDQLVLRELNEIRCKVVLPYEHFKENCRNSIKSKVLSLYEFLEEIQLPSSLEGRAKQLLECGEPELAMEYRQLWDLLTHALEQFVTLLGDHAVELDEFSKLLQILFAQYSVGAIPASLDRVIASDIPRLANRKVKTMIILGAEDSAIPQISSTQGLISEQDRELLSDYGIQLSAGIEEQMNREMSIIYTACAQPTDHLYIAWPASGETGEKKQASFLVEKLMDIFPNGLHEKQSKAVIANHPMSLQLMALSYPELLQEMEKDPAYMPFLNRLESAANWKRGRLAKQTVKDLYGETVSVSPSRLDQYKSCRFAYFLKYGLKAKARKQAGFFAPEYGTFVHYVLEYVLREGKKKGDLATMQDADIEILSKEAILRYTHDILGGLEQQTLRFRYLFSRLQKTVFLVIQNVMEELRNSEFQPIFFELGFGEGKEFPPVELSEGGITLQISGFVDRVDGWVKDGRLYLKVVDYKTGRKSFDFTDIWNGLGLQMLLYLFALEDHQAMFDNLEVIPAGVLYLPARDVVITGSRGMSDDVRRKMVDKELTRKGLILDDHDVICAMENPADSGVRFLPIRVSSKSGAISGDALVSAERLGRLKNHIQNLLKDICAELTQGTVTADPYWRGPSKNACLYCEYASACHFEEELGEDHRRWLPTIRNSEFWSYLEEQDEDGETDGV